MKFWPPCTNVFRCGPVAVLRDKPKVEKVLGVDPSGGRAPWGYALLKKISNDVWRIKVIGEESGRKVKKIIEELIISDRVKILMLDSPLGIGLETKPFRAVDKAVRLLGGKVLPPIWKGMKKLSLEGLILYFKYCEIGTVVLETHPFSAALITGLDIEFFRETFGRHSADALISAAVGAMWVENLDITICQSDGVLVLPASKFRLKKNEVILLKHLSDG